MDYSNKKAKKSGVVDWNPNKGSSYSVQSEASQRAQVKSGKMLTGKNK